MPAMTHAHRLDDVHDHLCRAMDALAAALAARPEAVDQRGTGGSKGGDAELTGLTDVVRLLTRAAERLSAISAPLHAARGDA
jgi:hypothetical protein